MTMLQLTWQPNILKSLKRKYGSPPLGLRNLGNTCYLNSVLQCLTYTPPLANFCLRYLHSSVCDSKAGKEKVDCPFCILERRITLSLNSEAVSDAPLKINSCLRVYAEHFRTGRQEDAHEFLRYVIDACHNACLRLKKLQQQQQKRKTGTANGGDISGPAETAVKEIFGGALQSQVKCLSCGFESNKIDEIMDISLDILHSGSLKEALQNFFQPEVLDGNNKYKCENCKKLVAARKQLSVLQAPNVLVIQLKRFEGMFAGKIDKPISFDETLVLSSHMCRGTKDEHPEYDLFGTIVHSGFSPDSGHYYAYIKNATGRWFCCNDSYVSVSSLQEVLSEKVYILFFSRTKQRPMDMVNGSKSHESNGSKRSVTQKSDCLENSVCTKIVSNQKPEAYNSNNGTRSFIRKSGSLEKTVTMRVSANHSDTNGLTNPLASNGTKPHTVQKCVLSEAPSSGMKEHVESEGYDGLDRSNSTDVALVNPVDFKQSFNHHCQTSNSMKSEIDQGLPIKERKSNYSDKKETRDENGYSTDLAQSEKTDLPVNESTSLKSEGVLSMNRGSSSLHIVNGENRHIYIDSKERIFTTVSRKSHNCQGSQNGEIMGSDYSCMKRKNENGPSCIFLARDNESVAEVEALKEVLRKEASTVLRSCGWSDEVQSFMHARKKLCQEAGNEASNILEIKNLLISQAKKNFISKVPESLKASLIKRLRLFGQEKKSFGP